MDILNENEILESDEQSYNHFKKDPEINVISKEEFERRTTKVFHLLWQALSKSFGPYGAPTIIYNYPYNHVTKDGYTIMKNLSMNVVESRIDEAIKQMAADICGRLNYSVGDGTTSAIIATNSIYEQYMENKDTFKSKFILPRDIIHKYEKIKDDVSKELDTYVQQIQSDDRDVLKKNIADVVYISSNGDEVFTEYISDLYKELGTPSIICRLAPDGVTKKTLINGYKYELVLNDKLYINNDENTMYIKDADVVIFATKITSRTYNSILKPLNLESKVRGRHLIVVAPSYDENMLVQTVVPEFNNEYKNTHKVNMVLTTYRAISAHTRKLVTDFAVLMNTIVIDRAKEEDIINKLSSGLNINQVFNIDGRTIDGLRCIAFKGEQSATFIKGIDELPEGVTALSDEFELVEDFVDLGYVKECNLGLKESIFLDMVYDEEKYQAILKDAKLDLEEKEKKYQKLGTFNIEVSQAQERLYALNLKMGVIEVGADSELSQALIKDAVDDAIRAASSAFKYGVVNGCNTNLIQSITTLWEKEEDPINKLLLDILRKGFINVYKTVIMNAFEDIKLPLIVNRLLTDKEQEMDNFLDMWMTDGNMGSPFYAFTDKIRYMLEDRIKDYSEIFDDKEILKKSIEMAIHEKPDFDESKFDNATPINSTDFPYYISVHEVLINYSLLTGKVFDISKFKYSDDIINSVQTDKEILKATIDLITLLIVGNQVVITQKDY